MKSGLNSFAFLYNLRDTVPPSEACPYGCVYWFLTQAKQQSSLGLSECSSCMRVGKPNLKPVSNLMGKMACV